MEYITDILHLSPEALLGLTLYLVGMQLKRSPVRDWMIPWILMLLGAVIYGLTGDTAGVDYQVHHPMLVNAERGLCVGAATAGIHQGCKQWLKFAAAQPDGGTAFLRKQDAGAPRDS